jgi:hypothetical protein
MVNNDNLTMSQKEIFRYDIIKRLIRKEINGTKASELLNLSIRQTKRLKLNVMESGASGLVHGNRGKPSNRCIPDLEKKKIILFLNKYYADFGPTFACEKLAEKHKLFRDPKTIRSIMIQKGLWNIKQKRKQQEHRAWRQRRTCFGEMEQFDGSYHHWFEDRGEKSCLLLSVDDATGQITQAEFSENEGVFPVFTFWLKYLEKHGKPLSIYTDKFSTYKMTQKVALENHDLKTQFQRALTELKIEPIFANSPQAKGRVERMFGTLQDRLTKELRLKNISAVLEANIFLQQEFMPKYNQQFGVQARNQANLHQSLSKNEKQRLESIFSRKTVRTVQNDFTISFDSQWHQLTKEQPATVCKRDEVIMEEHLDNSLKISFKGKYLNYKLIPKICKYQKHKQIPWVIAASQIKQPALIQV